LTLAAVLIGKSDAGQQIVRRAKEAVGAEPTPASTTSGAPITAATPLQAFSFDPAPGDGREHDGDLAALVDGDNATSWDTEGYNSRTFGIKSGVGAYVALPTSTALETLTIQSTTNDWSAAIYVSDNAAATLDGWGSPVQERSAIASGTTRIDLDGRRGRYVLVWITDLGDGAPDARTTISEISVTTA
jgi:eukaryotic-like serine/threonine-protein kinase